MYIYKISKNGNQVYVKILIFLSWKKSELQSSSLYIQKYHRSFV